MLTTIEFLTQPQQELLTKLIQKIILAVQPEKIICYGIRSSQYQEWSCFLNKEENRGNIDLCFDLLIIVASEEEQSEYDISQIAEQQGQPQAGITCITHQLRSVNDGLAFGDPFFCSLYHKGFLLYDAGRAPLSDPGSSETGALKKSIVEAYWSRWYGLGLNFFKGAADSVAYGRPDLTVFLLHQATEHTCIALIRVFTGYRPNTHDLTRLLTIIENFTEMLMIIFPCITKEEKALFDILQRGYSDTRYKDVYDIPPDTITLLVERVQELQVIAASLYKSRLAFLSLKERNHFPIV